jgi:hypothetical protein
MDYLGYMDIDENILKWEFDELDWIEVTSGSIQGQPL